MLYYVPVNIFKMFLWALMTIAIDATLKKAEKLSLVSKAHVMETYGGVEVSSLS
jgi:hypothetical protein